VIRVNGDNVNIASALAEKLPVQIIAPDIYKLVDDGPRYRRHFMDWGVFHVEHQFKKDWIKLTKLLKQRNAQLKTANRYQDVSHWDTDYVGLASHINASRHGYIENLKTHLSGYLSGLEGLDKVELSLLSGWPAGRDLRECLIEHFNLDSKRALTHYGPHKADLRIKIPSGMFRDIASRGQIKLLASTLKLAQLDYLDRIGHRNAVLLLDDITSEFDLLNQRRILDWALLTRSQLFVTCTDRKAADRLKIGSSCKLFHVEHGKFKELE
jgi:DNA replication and repair protein RecF